MSDVVLGFRAIRGGSVVVAVAAGPQLALSTFLATAAVGDRLAFEPYHVAAEMKGERTEIAAAVDEGRRRQAALAAEGLGRILAGLRADGFEPAAAALLVNRAGWITDLLSYSLSMPDHPPVAEGLAVRDALRSAFAGCGLRVREVDEKGLSELASAVLDRSGAALEAELKALGTVAGRPWRKEQKLAALAAWIEIAGR